MTAAAAQYIRMSTDTQNLSPGLQKHAIEAYAQAHGLRVVASYEDEGRSGLTLKNRGEMRRLLRDVSDEACPFSVVLVYDVSRWGRFQDTDESAYYEFHCRMNGVQVVYVNEPFDASPTPMLMLVKALKRAMAAEFSRDLAVKVQQAQRRAVELGFQIGRVPCIGVDRLAVSADQGQRRKLAHNERPRKGERVRWVPGPAHELALIRRIFEEYTSSDITLNKLTAALNAQGHTARGRPFTRTMMRCLVDAEILYGEFIWGRRKAGARVNRRRDDDPGVVRVPGAMEPVISRALWDSAQAKRRRAFHVFGHTRESLLRELGSALQMNPGLTVAEMQACGCASMGVYRRIFGTMREAMRLAGREGRALEAVSMERKCKAHALSNQFGRDLAGLMTRAGLSWVRPGKNQMFVLEGALRLRFRLVWQREHKSGLRWNLNPVRLGAFDFLVLVPVRHDNTAGELLLLSPEQYRRLGHWFDTDKVAATGRAQSGQELMALVRALAVGKPLPGALPRQ